MEYPRPGQWVTYGESVGVILDVLDDAVIIHVAAPDGTTLRMVKAPKKSVEKASPEQIPESRRLQEISTPSNGETWHSYFPMSAKILAWKRSLIELLHKI